MKTALRIIGLLCLIVLSIPYVLILNSFDPILGLIAVALTVIICITTCTLVFLKEKHDIWRIILKITGALCFVALLIPFSLFSGPIGVISNMIFVTVCLLALLKRERHIWKLIVLLIFTIVGICYIFNNNILGPIILYGEEWYHLRWSGNYRLYWWGNVINATLYKGGLISAITLIAVKIINKIKKKRQETAAKESEV